MTTKTKPETTFLGTCMDFEAEEIHAYDESEKSIKYETFRKHLGRDLAAEANAWFSVPLSKDWHVSFGKGIFKGKPVVVLHHSRIHHFFAIG